MTSNNTLTGSLIARNPFHPHLVQKPSKGTFLQPVLNHQENEHFWSPYSLSTLDMFLDKVK